MAPKVRESTAAKEVLNLHDVLTLIFEKLYLMHLLDYTTGSMATYRFVARSFAAVGFEFLWRLQGVRGLVHVPELHRQSCANHTFEIIDPAFGVNYSIKHRVNWQLQWPKLRILTLTTPPAPQTTQLFDHPLSQQNYFQRNLRALHLDHVPVSDDDLPSIADSCPWLTNVAFSTLQVSNVAARRGFLTFIEKLQLLETLSVTVSAYHPSVIQLLQAISRINGLKHLIFGLELQSAPGLEDMIANTMLKRRGVAAILADNPNPFSSLEYLKIFPTAVNALQLLLPRLLHLTNLRLILTTATDIVFGEVFDENVMASILLLPYLENLCLNAPTFQIDAWTFIGLRNLAAIKELDLTFGPMSVDGVPLEDDDLLVVIENLPLLETLTLDIPSAFTSMIMSAFSFHNPNIKGILLRGFWELDQFEHVRPGFSLPRLETLFLEFDKIEPLEEWTTEEMRAELVQSSDGYQMYHERALEILGNLRSAAPGLKYFYVSDVRPDSGLKTWVNHEFQVSLYFL